MEQQAPVGTGFPAAQAPWSAGEGLLLFVVFVLIHQMAALTAAFLSPGVRSPGAGAMLANGAVLVLCYVFLRKRCGRGANAARAIGLVVPPPWQAMRRAIVPGALGCVALAACLVAKAGLLEYLNIQPSQQQVVTEMQNQLQHSDFVSFGALVFLAVVAAPLAEELTFRGMLYLPLRAGIGRVGGALVAALMFAALHMSWATPLENLAAMAYLTILALVLTELMEATGSMLAPVLAHAAHNALMVLFASLAAGGG